MHRLRWFAPLALLLLVQLVPALVAAEDAPAHDAVKPVPRDGNWLKRHEKINARVKEKNVDMVFVGDSITEAWGGAGKGAWDKFYGHRNAANLGISGDRTQHVLWRLENGNIEGITPKLAVVMIGTNNSGSNTSEQIADGVTNIVKKLRTDLPGAKVLLLGIFPRGATPDDPRRKVNEGANAIIAKLADDQNVFYLDIGSKFLEADGTLSKEVMPDLLHLSDKSYTIWAEAIEPAVSKLMGENTGK